MKLSRKHTHNRICSAILMIAFIMMIVAWQPFTAWAAESQTQSGQNVSTEQMVADDDSADKKDIVIEVVEDIPADTIEDEAVPLASTPGTATHTGARVLVPVAVAVVIVLTWLFGRRRRAMAEVNLYRE